MKEWTEFGGRMAPFAKAELPDGQLVVRVGASRRFLVIRPGYGARVTMGSTPEHLREQVYQLCLDVLLGESRFPPYAFLDLLAEILG